jgi:U3 small nucleolar RNA-associated protein 21
MLFVCGITLHMVCFKVYSNIPIEFHNEIAFGPQFEVTCLLHPSAYLNKILLSSRQGKFQLWNVSSMRCIHEFETSFNEPITFLAQSPVVDIVAIGTLGGKISLHNIKTDKALFSLHVYTLLLIIFSKKERSLRLVSEQTSIQ